MADTLPLLNVYEIESDRGKTSYLCFLDPVLAGARGIEPASVLGRYATDKRGDFDVDGFEVNPAFVESLTGYMNEVTATKGEIVEQARALASGWLYVIDPRDTTGAEAEPPAANLLGAFAVDDTGQVVPGSFQYNKTHILFDREHGPSGVLHDRAFYDWLHGAG